MLSSFTLQDRLVNMSVDLRPVDLNPQLVIDQAQKFATWVLEWSQHEEPEDVHNLLGLNPEHHCW